MPEKRSSASGPASLPNRGARLRLGYHGSVGDLTTAQRDQTIAWLRDQESWSVPALQAYLQDTFQVVYQSVQSSYDRL